MLKYSLGTGAFLALLLSFSAVASDVDTEEKHESESNENSSPKDLSVSHFFGAGTGSSKEFDRIVETFKMGKNPIIKTIQSQSKSEYWSTHIKDAFMPHCTSLDLVSTIDMAKGPERELLLNIFFNEIARDDKRKGHLSDLLSQVSVSMPQKRAWWGKNPEEQLNVIAYAINKGDVEVMKSIFEAYPNLLVNVTADKAYISKLEENTTEKNLVVWLDAGVQVKDEYLTDGAIALISLVEKTEDIIVDKDIFFLAVHLYEKQRIADDVLSNIAKRFQ